MASSSDEVSEYYTVSGLTDRIVAALEVLGKGGEDLEPDDLAAVDAFHLRGRAATAELAAAAIVETGVEVLDVGCGLGGSCRYLAASHRCYVTGLDLTDEYCRVATMLSERMGLGEQTEFRCGSALEMPFPDESFDLVWTEHVQMNVRDKERLFAEIVRVLKPGGRFAFHDVFAGPAGSAHFPVPWAGDGSISFLMDPEELRLVLQLEELEPLLWEDVTEESRRWLDASLEKARSCGPRPLGLHLLMGADADLKLSNLARNLAEQRITVIQAVLAKAPEAA